MKVKKMSKRPEVKKSAVTRRKKKDRSKVTVKKFFECAFEDDTDGEKDKNIGMILNIWISSLSQIVFISIFVIFLHADAEDGERSDSDGESNLSPAGHKRSLIKSQDTDPSSYGYQKKNDKNLSDTGVSDDKDDDNSSVDLDDRYISNENLKVFFS